MLLVELKAASAGREIERLVYSKCLEVGQASYEHMLFAVFQEIQSSMMFRVHGI